VIGRLDLPPEGNRPRLGRLLGMVTRW
jgi:hypothetical protein